MTDTAVCDWLMDNANAPIRYRVARELLLDLETAKTLEGELLEHKAVRLWLQNLKPNTPPQHRWMEHGSFDFCLENALLKAVQLGLHGGLPQLTGAVGYYSEKMKNTAAPYRKGTDYFAIITAIITANLLCLANAENEQTHQFMLGSLDEMHRFVHRKIYNIYLTKEEQEKLPGVPACWKNKARFINPDVTQEYGFAYPLLYDIAGLHTLYHLKNPAINQKIDDVICYLTTDEFHRSIADGYGILAEGNGVYHSMGWDPKYPGWFDAAGYLENGNVPKLLFYALYCANYPDARKTQWFGDLLRSLETYKAKDGRYAFPAGWLAEKQGYAVMGHHLSFGENRRKRNWREIESTFYMQLLKRHENLL